MTDDELKQTINTTVAEYLKTGAFTSIKRTDTPTDANEVVPKKYVDTEVSSIVSILNSGSSSLTKSFTAGEDITTNDAVILASGNNLSNTISQTAQDSNAHTYTSNWFAQTFLTSASTVSLLAVKLKLIRTAALGGSFHVYLHATAAGLPTGAPLYDFSASPSTIGTAADNDIYTFTFSSPLAVSPATTYAIVFAFGGGNGTDYLAWYYKNSNVYADGSYCSTTDSGSTWTADTNKDFYFEVNECYQTAGRIYKGNSTQDDELANNFVGFAASTIGSTASGNVKVGGVANGFSSLTKGLYYYISSVAGAVSSVLAFPRSVGLAISDTEIDMGTVPPATMKTVASNSLKTAADTERNSQGNTYTMRKEIQVYRTGVYRIKFDLKTSIAGNDVYGKIYVDNVATGTERSTTLDTYTTYSEDITIGAGDKVELYTKCTNVATEAAYVRNFRLYYDRALTNTDNIITD